MCAVIGALIRAAAQLQSFIKLTAFRTAAPQREDKRLKQESEIWSGGHSEEG